MTKNKKEDKRKHYLVYQIDDNLNKMIYIGVHTTSKIKDSYMGSGSALKKAFKEYGIENFSKSILYDFNNEYDMLDKKSYVPPESIYGGFDIVLCRNVLIYFKSDFQEKIFNKLYRSLNENGILFLGEAEMPLEKFKTKFKRETKLCKIYQKR